MDKPLFSLWAEAVVEEIRSAPSLKEACELVESEFIHIYNKGIALGERQALDKAEEYWRQRGNISEG